MQNAHLNPLSRKRSLRAIAGLVVFSVVAVIFHAMYQAGIKGLGATTLPVLAAQEMPNAMLWRVFGYFIPGASGIVAAGWLWWVSQRRRMRIAAVMMIVSFAAQFAQGFVPANTMFLADPVNERAGLFYALWWIAGTLAVVVTAFDSKKPLLIGLAVIAVAAEVAGIAQLLPKAQGGLVMWAQLLIFAVNLEKSVRLT